MDERELAARMAGAADFVDDVAGVAFELPHHHVHDIGDEDVFLLRIGREIDRACRAAHQRVASDEELLEVLGEPSAPAVGRTAMAVMAQIPSIAVNSFKYVCEA